MICPNCRREIMSADCPYCNSKAQTNKTTFKNLVWQPSSIIIAVIWTICWVFEVFLAIDNELYLWQQIIVIFFGYVFYIPIGNLIIKYRKQIKNTLMRLIAKTTYHKDIKNTYHKRAYASFDYMEGHEFEYFCADVLRSNGFTNVEVTKGSGDQGIDILAEKDGIKYAIQCKCYNSDIGTKAVQEAFSGKTFYNCHISVVMTNRYFTPAAKQLADKNGVILWDRDKLNSLVLNMNQ